MPYIMLAAEHINIENYGAVAGSLLGMEINVLREMLPYLIAESKINPEMNYAWIGYIVETNMYVLMLY